jgi:1-aminocyclopropane-1-carboxylate deaminase/D-cysteine desulfhydrase-like pyridoxal-dependent ACC family enzyme
MPNSQSVGVAYADPEFTTCYASQEIGYSSAAQGVVTQATDKSTGVTLNKSMGRITMNGAALAAGAAASFTLTNNLLSVADTIIVNVSGGGTAAAYTAYVSSMAAGSAVLTLRNLSAGSLSEAVVLNFAIIHGQ